MILSGIMILAIIGFFLFIRFKYYDGIIFSESEDISNYLTGPKQSEFSYFVDGRFYRVNITLYSGLNDYFRSKNRDVFYIKEKPSDQEVVMKFVDNKKQKKAIRPIVDFIKSTSQDTDKQAKIAITLVQLIPYEKGATKDSPIKYPYEVLYTKKGVCSGKSYLMAHLLKELGFGVGIFRFYDEKHDAVAVKCPMEYSYRESGYCFVESSTLSIITDSETPYVDIGKIESEAVLISISDGISLNDVSEEYNDLMEIRRLVEKRELIDEEIDQLRELLERNGFDSSSLDKFR
jgi:hypothetical protein